MISVTPEVVQVGNARKVKVTVRDGERVLYADVLDPLDASRRQRTVRKLAERAGDPLAAPQIEQALLQCMSMIHDEPPETAGAEGADDMPAGDMHTVVRPELVIDRGVAAVAVAEVIVRGGEAVGRWTLYVHTRDGRRFRSPMARSLEVGQARIWLHPRPPTPLLPIVAGWSCASRKRWLDGTERASAPDVFQSLCAAFDDFLDLPAADDGDRPFRSPATAVLALWTMLTYCYPTWEAVPYLYVGGPAGSGKTRVFELLSRLVFRPISSSNLSAPALFRTLHDRGGTLLLDEAERLGEGSPEVAELRSILLAGYKRGGRATRLENSGDSFQMAEFQVFGPKAVACISGLPGPLLSRCIPIQMFRSPPDSPKPRRRLDEDGDRWQSLRDKLHVLALEEMGFAAPDLAQRSDICPLGGRAYELWQPILALAGWIDAEDRLGLLSMLADYARRMVLVGQEELTSEEDQTLLRVLCEMLRAGRSPTTREVLLRAQQVDNETFRRWSARRAAEVMRRYGLSTTKVDRRREYRDVRIEHLRAIERSYGFDLNTDGQLRVNVTGFRLY